MAKGVKPESEADGGVGLGPDPAIESPAWRTSPTVQEAFEKSAGLR